MTKTLVDLLRHGEPVGGSRYRGQIDDPLSETGWRQMRAAVGEHRPWDVVLSSPLSRCQAFARELCDRHHLPLVVDERLKELGFGEWEGKTRDEIVVHDPERLLNFFRDPQRYRPENAEALSDFEIRVIAAWDGMLDRFTGRHILLVGHAGMIRMVIRHVLNAPLDAMFHIQVPNAGISRIQVDGEGDARFARLLFHAGVL